MSENRKRIASSPIIASNPKLRKTAHTKPAIVGTKASMARARAVSAQLTGNRSSPVRKRKPEEPKTLARSYKTTAAGLKERPAWDLRGKLADMDSLYKLNLQRMDELRKFKRELEIIKDEKESQEKEALQRAAELRTKLQELERRHTVEVEDLHASQRVEYQKLEDDNLNHSRRLTAMEIEVSDAKHKLELEAAHLDSVKQENESLKNSIHEISLKYENSDAENRNLDNAIQQLEVSLVNKEKEIESKRSKLQEIDASVQKLESKLSDANTDRARLLGKIKDLEAKKENTRRKA